MAFLRSRLIGYGTAVLLGSYGGVGATMQDSIKAGPIEEVEIEASYSMKPTLDSLVCEIEKRGVDTIKISERKCLYSRIEYRSPDNKDIVFEYVNELTNHDERMFIGLRPSPDKSPNLVYMDAHDSSNLRDCPDGVADRKTRIFLDEFGQTTKWNSPSISENWDYQIRLREVLAQYLVENKK
ncbi:MAG TPA: hypothetical protein VJH92_06565 [Candidatus Nanoarchaeia archaeon]|nr:hypothetical protein [Candidatus Nanoarchaeia archaeon]